MSDNWSGSPKTLSKKEFRELVCALIAFVEEAKAHINSRSALDDVIAFHNRYTCAVALLFEWAHGTRCTKIERRTVQAILGSELYSLVSDKKSDFYGFIRVLPKTSIIRALLRGYVEHLRATAEFLRKRKHPAAKQLGRIASGKLPDHAAFVLIERIGVRNNHGYRNVRHADLVQLAREVFASCEITFAPEDINRPRHFWYGMAVAEEVSQHAIDAAFGHHTAGAEPHGTFSGTSVREVCDYLRPFFEKIQGELGFRELPRRGSREARYLTELLGELPRAVRMVPNRYLLKKIQDDDLLVRDVFVREQDPAFTTQTLLAHKHLDNLACSYLASRQPERAPAGALLFSLVVFDCVLVRAEQQRILRELTEEMCFQAGAHAVAEVVENGRPLLQRSISRHTLSALALLHPTEEVAFESALQELHDLLRQLSSKWPAITPGESLSLLSAIAMHWFAVEVAPGTLFVALHKAPFVCADQLARIHHGLRCISKPKASAEMPLRVGFGFERVNAVVLDWNRRVPPGNAKKWSASRKQGCVGQLSELLASPADVYEAQMIGQYIADLTGKGARPLSVSTIAARGAKTAAVYSFFRREGTFELSQDVYEEVVAALGGKIVPTPDGIAPRESNSARWILEHIYYCLEQQGFSVPLGLLTSRGVKQPTPARLPVYSTHADIKRARDRLDDRYGWNGGLYKFAGLRLGFHRATGCRENELRHLMSNDVDEVNCLVHFTTLDEDHLKNEASRGTAPFPSELAPELAELKRERRHIRRAEHVRLFTDHQLDDKVFEEISRAITQEMGAVIGCIEFRTHDLRSAAASDICVNTPGGVEALLKAEWRGTCIQVLGRDELEQKYIRFHLAAAHVRHASALTTCRFYNVAGVLDLRREVDIAQSRWPLGPTYVAGMTARKRQSLYSAKHKKRKRSEKGGGSLSSTPEESSTLLEDHWRDLLSMLPTPWITSAAAPEYSAVAPSNNADPAALIESMLLMSLGLSATGAAMALGMAESVVQQQYSRLIGLGALLRVHLQPRKNLRVFGQPGGGESPSAARAKSFARAVAQRTAALKASAPLIAASVCKKGHALEVVDEQQFIDLIRLIGPLAQPEFRVIASICQASADARKRACSVARKSGVQVSSVLGKGRRFAQIHFTHAPRDRGALGDLSSFSPRHIGIAGRMFVTGLLAGIL